MLGRSANAVTRLIRQIDGPDEEVTTTAIPGKSVTTSQYIQGCLVMAAMREGVVASIRNVGSRGYPVRRAVLLQPAFPVGEILVAGILLKFRFKG